MQFHASVLGQIFLLAWIAATLGSAAILFVLFGPVPVKRRVTLVPRLPASAPSPPPSLVAQLAPACEQRFTPAQPIAPAPEPHATAAQPVGPMPAAAAAPPVRKPKGAKVQPLPKKRAARGTDSPFAPVVRHRQVREEDAATNPVRVFEADELTTVDY